MAFRIAEPAAFAVFAAPPAADGRLRNGLRGRRTTRFRDAPDFANRGEKPRNGSPDRRTSRFRHVRTAPIRDATPRSGPPDRRTSRRVLDRGCCSDVHPRRTRGPSSDARRRNGLRPLPRTGRESGGLRSCVGRIPVFRQEATLFVPVRHAGVPRHFTLPSTLPAPRLGFLLRCGDDGVELCLRAASRQTLPSSVSPILVLIFPPHVPWRAPRWEFLAC